MVKKVRAGLSLRQFGGARSVSSVGAKNDSIFRRPVKATGWAFLSSMTAKSYCFFAYQPQKHAVMPPATIQKKIELMIALMKSNAMVFSS